MSFSDQLRDFCACPNAVNWVGEKTLEEAWETCQRADWMLWLASRVCDRKLVVSAGSACARTALPYTQDPRVAACLDVVDRWVLGEATIEEVRVAREGARLAHGAAAEAAEAVAYAAESTAFAAAYIIDVTDFSVGAAAYAAYAKDVTDPCAETLREQAEIKSQKEQADIVRGIISAETVLIGLDSLEGEIL